jgi:catechol 2,3-dioxygenase-like lactoylglutathione lyase family enzyme
MKLHHVSLMVSDVERSADFYTAMLGLRRLDRPIFKSIGAWMSAAHLEVHLIQYRADAAPPPARVAAPDDTHFALNTDDFEGFVHHLETHGFREDAPMESLSRIRIRREGPAGFPQVFLLDPDRNIIEVNGAP